MYTQSMVTKVQKWGNSLGVRLPRSAAQEAGVRVGSEVDVRASNGGIALVPVRPKRYRLRDLLAKVKSSNRPAADDFGGPVGKEIL